MPRPNKGYQLSDEPNATGSYEIVWSEKGRSKRKSTGTGDYAEAQIIHAEFVLAMREGVSGLVPSATGAPLPAASSGPTVADILTYYMVEWVAYLDLQTTREQATRCCHLIIASMGDVAVADLSDEHIRRFVRGRALGNVFYLDEQGRKVGKKGGTATARNDLSYLMAGLNFAAKNKKIARAALPELTLPDKGDPRERYLSREEAALVISTAAPAPRERMSRLFRLLVIGLATAARQEAILQLTWDRVDFVTGLIDFNVPGRRKTKKRRAVVPMSDDLRAMLERAFRERISDLVLDPGCRCSVMFRRHLRRCKIEVPTGSGGTHIMRHTWATWQAQAGQSMTYIAAVLADTVYTTERVYAKHSPKTLQGAVNLLPLPGVQAAVSSGVTPEMGANIAKLCSPLPGPAQVENPVMAEENKVRRA